jgi:Fe-Mn family superoxide dismutase
MPFILPELPYDEISFGGLISAETFDFHHGKHHKAYVDKTNALVADDAALSGAPLSKVITAAKAKGNMQHATVQQRHANLEPQFLLAVSDT